MPSPWTSCTVELRITALVFQALSGGIAEIAAADHDANPLVGIPGGYSVHQHVVEVLIDAARGENTTRPLSLLFMLPPNTS